MCSDTWTNLNSTKSSDSTHNDIYIVYHIRAQLYRHTWLPNCWQWQCSHLYPGPHSPHGIAERRASTPSLSSKKSDDWSLWQYRKLIHPWAISDGSNCYCYVVKMASSSNSWQSSIPHALEYRKKRMLCMHNLCTLFSTWLGDHEWNARTRSFNKPLQPKGWVKSEKFGRYSCQPRLIYKFLLFAYAYDHCMHVVYTQYIYDC